MQLIPINSRNGVVAYAQVDEADADYMRQYSWSLQEGYARCAVGRPQIQIKMHALLSSCPAGMSTDHINGNKLDNRRVNLRICSLDDNNLNRGKQSNNRSGYKGVYRGRYGWRAQIRKDKRRHNLGEFATPETAYAAYCNACRRLHGEYANVS